MWSPFKFCFEIHNLRHYTEAAETVGIGGTWGAATPGVVSVSGAGREQGGRTTSGEEPRPDWAKGGYAGKGINKRVQPYHAWRPQAGRGGGLACARCGFGLAPAVRRSELQVDISSTPC